MQLITGLALAGGTIAAGAIGYGAYRMIGDEVGDKRFVRAETREGTNDIGIRVDESVDRIFGAHDTRPPAGHIGAGEWQIEVPVRHTDGSMRTYLRPGAGELLRSVDEASNGDGAVSRAELSSYLEDLADPDGVVRGREAGQIRELVDDDGLHVEMLATDHPTNAKVDAEEAIALLRAGTELETRADGTVYQLQRDEEARDYAVLIERTEAEYAATGDPWKVLERHASAHDAVSALSELGASNFRLLG